MKFRQSLVLLPAIALTACSGGNDNPPQTMKDPITPGSVVYAYPADGQTEVSPRTDLILRFSLAVTDEPDALADKIQVTADGDPVSFDISKIDEGRSLKLTPSSDLAPSAEYTVSFTDDLAAGERSIPNPNATGPEGIQFTTRGVLPGVAGTASLDDEFAVARMIPAEGSAFLPMDFSTFRLQLTQPVHPDWQRMGGTVELLDSDGEPVNASVLVRERAITIDPCLADTPDRCGREEDLLTPGETYTIRLSSLPGLYGDTLDDTLEVTPTDTSPNVVLYQRIIDSGLNAGESSETAQKSVLNGQIINGITLESVLQGNAGPSQQTADLYAQLAYAPNFEGDIGVPLRIARNSKLLSTSLDIRINGLVPAIEKQTGEVLKTGDIKVTMLSDATGYLLPNPYTESRSAPRHVRLWMDIAMSTEEAMPNAALSQDIMGLELAGIARVEDGLLTIDAIGMVEPNLLGMENTESTIAFRIQADTSADVQMDAEENRETDTTGPTLVSWMPGPTDDPAGNRQELQRPGDPVILYFDEPLDRESVREGITLTANGTNYNYADGNLKVRVDGTSIALSPAGGLEHGLEYTLGIGSAVTDLSGNPATDQTLSFSLPELGELSAPMVLSTYPGFPCVTEDLDLSQDSHGYCLDLPSADTDINRPADQPRDELFVTDLPQNRPITVTFSQSMRPDSLNGDTFFVESINEQTSEATPVSGRLEKFRQKLRFYPDEPWENGALYRYTLVSEMPTETEENPTCDEGNTPTIICGASNAALNTDVLVNPVDTGGPDMVIYFRGAEAVSSVLNPLRTLPVRDVNANLALDCEDGEGNATPGSADCVEPFPLDDSAAGADGEFPTPENAARLSFASEEVNSEFIAQEIVGRIGCTPESEEDCPKNQFLYQTLHLNSEVVGRTTDPETGQPAVKVLLYPSLIVTTPVSVYLSDPLGEQPIGPQLLRMRYAKSDPDCSQNCRRDGAIEGYIVRDDSGVPIFKSDVELTLDAPNLTPSAFGGPLFDTDHNLFSYPLSLELAGDISFFDDGRMQIRQKNEGMSSPINANVTYSGTGTELLLAGLSLELPVSGVLLNLIANPVKEITVEE